MIKNIPNTLEECFKELEENVEKESLKQWAHLGEKKAVGTIHFNLGMSMRNLWGLWLGKSKLCKFFYSIGIKHADDMSGIISTSFYRHLNNKPINLEKQVKVYWKYWIENKEFNLLPINNKIEVSMEYLILFDEFVKEKFPKLKL